MVPLCSSAEAVAARGRGQGCNWRLIIDPLETIVWDRGYNDGILFEGNI